ncbi:aldo/keto reductase [Rhodococcus sp. WAY2]|uniref:aldo/keto reductase n=1 Tax=Rhodococcus sp. WAY2 TaxID=2663121 RepID=UPI00131FF186|nr:aldo/keto reductase [Rhodococcus sp. WAY2]QHE73282.1 putative oxidoreductase [Rhodococcus sp. WAY2]
MKYVPFGRSGLLVSELVLGAATFGDTVEEDAAVGLVERALEAGINTFDTANIYAGGRSEVVLGRALARHRDSVIISTKVGSRVGDGEGELARARSPEGLDHAERWAHGIAPTDAGLSRKHLTAGLDASLRRLGTDYIDIYTVHLYDPLTGIEELMRTLEGFVASGKVRSIACSGWKPWQVYKSLWISDRLGISRFEGIQLPISLLVPEHLRDAVPACLAEEVSVLAHQVLAGGALTGRYVDGQAPSESSRMGSRVTYRQRYDTSAARAKVGALVELARQWGIAPGHLALRWTLDYPGVTSVLLGASTPNQLNDAVAGTQAVIEPALRAALSDIAHETSSRR